MEPKGMFNCLLDYFYVWQALSTAMSITYHALTLQSKPDKPHPLQYLCKKTTLTQEPCHSDQPCVCQRLEHNLR